MEPSIDTRLVSAPQASIHYQTQSCDSISCYGNSVERTDEIEYRIYEFSPSRTIESDTGYGP